MGVRMRADSTGSRAREQQHRQAGAGRAEPSSLSYAGLSARPMAAAAALRHLAGMARSTMSPRSDTLIPRGAPLARAAGTSWRFAVGVLRDFKANQGLLLAGAVAYYALLSLLPMLVLVVIALSHFVEAQRLLGTIGEYLNFIVPGYAGPIVDQLSLVLQHREVIGGFLLVSIFFFSSLAFTVLENAMSVIFLHRVAIRRRRFFVSAVLPYFFILFLGAGLLVATVVSGRLGVLATRDVAVMGVEHSLQAVSSVLLYFVGVAGEVLVVTAIYLVMPVGSMRWRHALIGGITACVLWEITRHFLVWYYATLSQIQVVYGSFAAAIAVLLSVEVAAAFLLLGAQVIANYERAVRARPKARSRRTGMHVVAPREPAKL
jgi:YihY family inner membrane protein